MCALIVVLLLCSQEHKPSLQRKQKLSLHSICNCLWRNILMLTIALLLVFIGMQQFWAGKLSGFGLKMLTQDKGNFCNGGAQSGSSVAFLCLRNRAYFHCIIMPNKYDKLLQKACTKLGSSVRFCVVYKLMKCQVNLNSCQLKLLKK